VGVDGVVPGVVCGFELVVGTLCVVETLWVCVVVVVVGAGVLLVVELVVLAVVELVVVVFCGFAHWRCASVLTVVAPRARRLTSAELVLGERLRSALSSVRTEVLVRAQECRRTALEIAFKALTIVRLSAAESRPLPLPLDPHATANAAVRPSTAASSARRRNRRGAAGTTG
jgi:hypothetical protein